MIDGLEKVLTEVELALELPVGRIGGRTKGDCCGCGDRLLTDREVIWDELDESLAEVSVL